MLPRKQLHNPLRPANASREEAVSDSCLTIISLGGVGQLSLVFMPSSVRSFGSTNAILLPESILVILPRREPDEVERINECQKEGPVLNHAWAFELCLPINSKIYLVVVRQIFQRWVNVEEVAVQ